MCLFQLWFPLDICPVVGFLGHMVVLRGFPGSTSGKQPACQCRRHKICEFDLWVGKMSWRRAWQLTPLFLPGESHGLRSLVGCNPQDCQESDTTEWLYFSLYIISSVQFSSVSQSCPTLCDPMNCSTPSLSVHHQLLEFTQTHVHRVSDAIQPSDPLSSPSPPAFNLYQHQGLFKWISSLHQAAKVLEFQLHYQFLQWIFRTEFL